MSTKPSFLSVSDRLSTHSDQWSKTLYQVLRDFRVAVPCIVQSFDATNQTITAQPVTQEKMDVNSNGVPIPTDSPLPLLIDVPLLVMGGGPFVITFPVQAGDECLVIFSDMDFNAWWQNGGTGNVQEDNRRHHITDGFAIVGPRSNPKAIGSYDNADAVIRTVDNSVRIILTTTGITIVGTSLTLDSNTTLNGMLTINGNLGFYDHTPVTKPVITGSKSGNTALASLLTALAGMGLLTDSTT